jgi:2',3'-cyclic-nucleotide 2'-phosphodiesterase (5'-nucleotidase family)
MKKLLYIFFTFCIAGTFQLFADQGNEITIYYSNSLNGNLVGCDCKGNPKAGLGKRVHYIRNYVDQSNAVLIDGGDMLDVYPDPEAARIIFSTYEELGYAAIGVGDQELSNGIDDFFEYSNSYPLLSENLSIVPSTGGKKELEGSKIIKRGKYTIGIFSITDPDIFVLYDNDIRKHLRVDDPVQAALRAIEDFSSKSPNIVILLYHGFSENAEDLLSRVKGIHVALISHEQKTIDAQTWHDTVVVAPGNDGNTLGMLTVRKNWLGSLRFDNRFRTFSFLDDPDDPSYQARIDEYMESLSSGIKVD